MSDEKLNTYFCAGERLPQKEVLRQANIFKSSPCSPGNFLDIFPNMAVVLNHRRQVIYYNQSMANWCQKNRQNEPQLGSRLGEIFGCINSTVSPYGCGNAENCSVCGAGLAIIETIQVRQLAEKECRIIIEQINQREYLDLRVTTSPVIVGSEQYILLFAQDISSEKRRCTLERIFFHDVLNTSGVLLALSELMLKTENCQELNDLLHNNRSAAIQLVEEVEEQQDLLKAENNQLTVEMNTVNSISLLLEVVDRFGSERAAFFGIKLEMDPKAHNIDFSSNCTLLRRIIGNMLKNALEATKPGQIVRLGCRQKQEFIEFWVNNQEIMPKDVQLQIFQRSFSTKSKDRGLGTYSMKLLTERYLKGSISFSVSQQEGTTFYARYPISS